MRQPDLAESEDLAAAAQFKKTAGVIGIVGEGALGRTAVPVPRER